MSLLKYFDRVPSKSSSVSAGDITVSLPLITTKLITPTEDEVVFINIILPVSPQVLFTHVLVND